MTTPTNESSTPDPSPEPPQEWILDLIREVGDKATAQVRQEMQAQLSASSQQTNSETLSHEEQREMAAQSVLRNGKASTIEEAQKMVDEAI